MVGLARSKPYDGSSSSPSRSPVRATAGTYLLKGYSVVNERDIAFFVSVLRSGSDEDSRQVYFNAGEFTKIKIWRYYFMDVVAIFAGAFYALRFSSHGKRYVVQPIDTQW